jgi:carbon starvation protein
LIFSIFVWLALVLVDAIFVLFAAKTFVSEKSVILPAFGIIPIAVIVGYFLYRKNSNQTKTTIFGLASLFILILLGPKLHINLSLNVWMFILLAYGYAASVTPVNILLQPRDYLSGYLLVFGILFGGIGILFSHPQLQVPAFKIASSASAKPIWPLLFVTVACGAISGFHSLVASGTTSKQLDKESHAVAVGYGGMIVEGVLAVIALIAVAAGLSSGEVKNLASNPIGAFGVGYGNLTYSILGPYGKIFALVVLNAFVLTTLDSATRITRYLTQEIFGLRNKHIATSIVILFAGWLAMSGEGGKIWPVFGASNQLVAALALIVISAWLMQNGRRIRYTLWPMLFMLVTTMYALYLQARGFLGENNYILAGISIVLMILAIILFAEAAVFWVKKRKISTLSKL